MPAPEGLLLDLLSVVKKMIAILGGLGRRLLVGGLAWARKGGVVIIWSLGLLRRGFLIGLPGAWVEVLRSVQARVMSDGLRSPRQALAEIGPSQVDGWGDGWGSHWSAKIDLCM